MNLNELGAIMRDVLPVGIIAGAIASEVLKPPPITAEELEQAALWGLTFGAWFKIGLLIALVLLILERASSTYRNIKEANRASSNNDDG